jgi:Flp pilus assembly protein TadG
MTSTSRTQADHTPIAIRDVRSDARPRRAMPWLWQAQTVLARCRRDNKGVSSVVFAMSATALLGMAALATDGGLLYLARQRMQSAADAAAIAAASAQQYRTRQQALDAAREVAGLNSFTEDTSTVLVASPPSRGAFTTTSTAVEVILRHKQPVFLMPVFIGNDGAIVEARAVALLRTTTEVCFLALRGKVLLQNSSSITFQDCSIGSNSAVTGAVTIPQSNSAITAYSVVTPGTCAGCESTLPSSYYHYMTLPGGYQEGADKIANPYADLDASIPPGESCTTDKQISFQGTMKPFSATGKVYCGTGSQTTYRVENTGSVSFASGTYIFRNASLSVSSIASFSCTGCTFIFIGDTPGTFSITNTSKATLSAPAVNTYNSVYNGMLIYRRADASGAIKGSSSSPTLNLQSVGSFDLSGGIYLPNAYAKFSNTSGVSSKNCLAIVAGSLEVSSLSTVRIDTSGCPDNNVPVAAVKVPRLVE